MLLTGISTILFLLLIVLPLLIRAERQRNLALLQSRQANQLLAEMVNERNEALILLKTQLINYAHLNSHQVRGPLARMIGLINLLKLENDPRKREQLVEYVDTSLSELDAIIGEINACLSKSIWEDSTIPTAALTTGDTPIPSGSRAEQ